MSTPADFGLITPTGSDLIRDGDDAISTNAVRLAEALAITRANPIRSRGVLASGSDVNSLHRSTDNGLWVASTTSSYTNLPFTGGGMLLVENSGAGTGSQRAWRNGTSLYWEREVKNAYATPVTWWDWRTPGVVLPQELTAGIDFDAQRNTGDWLIPNTSIAAACSGWPAGVPHGPAHLQVRAIRTGVAFQQLHSYGSGGTLLERHTSAISPTPFPWSAWVDLAAAASAPPSAGLANTMLLDDWSRRRGGTRTIPTGAVALRFDHGLASFDTKIRPLLEARNLPYALALNSGNWAHPENAGITAATVNSWAATGLCEVWNHGRTHTGSESEAGWTSEIVTGLTELRAQLPAFEIDGFAIPGTGGVGYGDFGSAQSVTEFYATPAGRLILSHHAISTGYIPDTDLRILDGRPRQGLGHYTIDTATPTQIQTKIADAQATRRGLQLMLHPSLVDTAGHITTATLTDVLDHIAGERDAGRLTVVGPYDLLLTEAA